MQRREAAHRQADHVRALDTEVIEDAKRIVAGALLRIALGSPRARPGAGSRARYR